MKREGILRRVVQGSAQSADVRGRFPFRISPNRIRMRVTRVIMRDEIEVCGERVYREGVFVERRC